MERSCAPCFFTLFISITLHDIVGFVEQFFLSPKARSATSNEPSHALQTHDLAIDKVRLLDRNQKRCSASWFMHLPPPLPPFTSCLPLLSTGCSPMALLSSRCRTSWPILRSGRLRWAAPACHRWLLSWAGPWRWPRLAPLSACLQVSLLAARVLGLRLLCSQGAVPRHT